MPGAKCNDKGHRVSYPTNLLQGWWKETKGVRQAWVGQIRASLVAPLVKNPPTMHKTPIPGEGIGYPLQYSWVSLVAQMVKNLPVMWETWVQSLGLGRSPGGEHGNPLQYSCLENPHRQRSLVGYSSCGHKESDTTEQLSGNRADKLIHWSTMKMQEHIR